MEHRWRHVWLENYSRGATSYMPWVAVNFELSLRFLRLSCTFHSRRTYNHPKTMQSIQCLGWTNNRKVNGGFSKIKNSSVRHFPDTSGTRYGQASYLWLASEDNQIHCSLLLGKSRVIPTKYVSIPKLELTAATLSIYKDVSNKERTWAIRSNKY